MSLVDLAVLGAQTVLGLVALAAGATKVASHESQVEEFERFGYPPWFRIAIGVTEVTGGLALLAGSVLAPLAVLGAALVTGVMTGAVGTHVRVDDPPSKLAVPAVLLVLAVLVVTAHVQGIPG